MRATYAAEVLPAKVRSFLNSYRIFNLRQREGTQRRSQSSTQKVIGEMTCRSPILA